MEQPQTAPMDSLWVTSLHIWHSANVCAYVCVYSMCVGAVHCVYAVLHVCTCGVFHVLCIVCAYMLCGYIWYVYGKFVFVCMWCVLNMCTHMGVPVVCVYMVYVCGCMYVASAHMV